MLLYLTLSPTLADMAHNRAQENNIARSSALRAAWPSRHPSWSARPLPIPLPEKVAHKFHNILDREV
jgi:hypothetical protein